MPVLHGYIVMCMPILTTHIKLCAVSASLCWQHRSSSVWSVRVYFVKVYQSIRSAHVYICWLGTYKSLGIVSTWLRWLPTLIVSACLCWLRSYSIAFACQNTLTTHVKLCIVSLFTTSIELWNLHVDYTHTAVHSLMHDCLMCWWEWSTHLSLWQGWEEGGFVKIMEALVKTSGE